MARRTTFKSQPTQPSVAVAGAKMLRTVRESVGGAAMGGPPPKPDPMDSEETRMDIAMENWRQESEADSS